MLVKRLFVGWVQKEAPMERVHQFLESWQAPALDAGHECLPDSILVAIATGKVANEDYQAHVQACQACGIVVKQLRHTQQEPGKNLRSLIDQAKQDAAKLQRERQLKSRWMKVSFRDTWIPIAAAAAVVLALIWGPIVKHRLISVGQNQAEIRLGVDDQFTPALRSLQTAIAVLSSPDTTMEQKHLAALAAREKVVAIDADSLTETQIKTLNAQSGDVQALHNAALLAQSRPKQPKQDLQLDVYTAYERYKAASDSNAGQFLVAPVDPQQALNNAKQDIQVSTSGKAVVVVPRITSESRDSRWFSSAMQQVADEKRVDVEIHRGTMVQTFRPQN